MNLIEQLGGYEKSKRELKLKEDGSMFQCCTAITADMIRDALLEHRRENNIFEKGDAVTWKAHFKGEWRCGFGFITDIDEEIECVNIDNCVGVDIYEIKHATPKEIAQGYRDE